MASYCVNKNAQDTGEHEVHTYNCEHLPDPVNRLHLGDFNICQEAIIKTKEHYDNVDGCYYCSRECHTR